MKKTAVLLLSMLLAIAFVFAETESTTDVFKTTKELTAYKEYVDSSAATPAVTLNIYTNSNYNTSINDGNNVTISSLNTQTDAFYWKLTGNLYGQVQVSFTFSPMYLGQMSRLGSMEATEANRVIPYTVQLSHVATKVNSKTATINSSPNAATNQNYDYQQSFTSGSGWSATKTTVYYKFGDSINPASPSATVLTVPSTLTTTYDLSVYTSRRTKGNGNNYSDYTETIETLGTTWERTGKCQVTLNLTNGSWDNNGDTVTPLGGQYQAYVIVTLTTGS